MHVLSMGLLLLLWIARHAYGEQPHAKSLHQQYGFLISNRLGVQHCALPGQIDKTDVELHAWIRVVPGVRCNQGQAGSKSSVPCVKVRGYAMILDANPVPRHKKGVTKQLQNADGLVPMLPKRWFLRSSLSGRDYSIMLNVPAQQHSHVLDVAGEFVAPDSDYALDMNLTVWELRVPGFNWHCTVVAQSPTLATRWRSATRSQGGSTEAPATRPVPPAHVNAASLTTNTQAVYLLSPFFNVNITHYAILLWHHVAWHQHLGISRYLLYVNQDLIPLVHNPLIQDLELQGVLQVVLFVDLPRHVSQEDTQEARVVDAYLLQVITYNHALLALWGTDSLVLVADVDEYVLTPKPTNLIQVFKDCPEPPDDDDDGRPVGGILIRRANAVCGTSPPVKSDLQCNSNSSYWSAWLSQQPYDVARGSVAHPVSMVTAAVDIDFTSRIEVKPVLDPNVHKDVHVHSFWTMKGYRQAVANPACAKLLHLVNLFSRRYDDTPGMDAAEASKWWWPAQRLLAGGGRYSPGCELVWHGLRRWWPAAVCVSHVLDQGHNYRRGLLGHAYRSSLPFPSITCVCMRRELFIYWYSAGCSSDP